jgi:hypothetical protein
MIDLPIVKISQRELQDKFNRNDGGSPLRMDSLRKECTYDQPAHPRSGQVAGARSRIDKFFDGDQLVIVVHYFLKPDGTLGWSGKYDPKKLLISGVLYWSQ